MKLLPANLVFFRLFPLQRCESTYFRFYMGRIICLSFISIFSFFL